MTSNPLTLTAINGEPRVYDLHLAECLGFERPADIRKLIKRNEEKLNKFNHIATVARCIELGNGAKRAVDEYYLDRKQSIYIAMKSETDKAFEVQEDIIRVYDAYLNGDLPGPVVLQPRLHFVLRGCLRSFDTTRDAWARQCLIYQIKSLHTALGLPIPPMHLVGKDSAQAQLEV